MVGGRMNVPNSGTCFRCDEPGHWAQDCPELIPAGSEAEHEARILRFIDRWAAGQMSREQKRVSISLENQMWYGTNCKTTLTYPPRKL
jgi:hypothetical protein